jgi:hypothetical protein
LVLVLVHQRKTLGSAKLNHHSSLHVRDDGRPEIR